MPISVQLSLEELAELRKQAITMANEMSEWLSNNTDAEDYFFRSGQLRKLISQLDNWEQAGIEISTNYGNAGSAVDQINRATKSLQAATANVNSIGSKVDVFGAFVDLMVALSAGNPEDIIKKSVALCDTIQKL